MTTASQLGSLELSGLDGANPLGFLAALGALLAARAAGEATARLRWKRAHSWLPVLEGLSAGDPQRLSELLALAMRGKDVDPEAETKRAAAERASKLAAATVNKKMGEIKKRSLKSGERKAAVEAEVRFLQQEYERRRREWLHALEDAVPRPELALGKKIDCTDDEYRERAAAFRSELNSASREPLDLLAAFGTDAHCTKSEGNSVLEPTPFCFIKGSGQQYFLDTIRKLITKVDGRQVQQALFQPWTYRDRKLSMRWDPVEDRRYALLDTDPGDEEAPTVWMANLLAYHGLAFFACAPARTGLGATGWTSIDKEEAFTWPIWEFPAAPDVIRSLLQLQELRLPHPDPAILRNRGVAAAFRSRRISGSKYKWNFSPARAV